MLRRSFTFRSAGNKTKDFCANVPDLKDWSRLGNEMVSKSAGRCFDKTVLERSIIPTRHFQKSLFRLPIPKLEDTCKKYLASVQPLVTPDAFGKTSSYVEAFQ